MSKSKPHSPIQYHFAVRSYHASDLSSEDDWHGAERYSHRLPHDAARCHCLCLMEQFAEIDLAHMDQQLVAVRRLADNYTWLYRSTVITSGSVRLLSLSQISHYGFGK